MTQGHIEFGIETTPCDVNEFKVSICYKRENELKKEGNGCKKKEDIKQTTTRAHEEEKQWTWL